METIHLLRDISVVILAIPVIVFMIIPIGALFFVNKGVSSLLKMMRRYAPEVQSRFRQAAEMAEFGSQKVAGPVIATEAFGSRIQRMRRRLF